MTEAGKDVLPPWLEYNATQHTLAGVPTVKDKGTYILSVAKEMFAVTVTEATKSHIAQPTSIDEQITCKPHDSITVAYVKLNSDTDAMTALKKAELMLSLASHLSLKPNHISMSTNPTDLVDTSLALVSGTGDVPMVDSRLSALSWIVGCGAVKTHHMDILEKLESTAKDGSLSRSLSAPVSGWQVQSNQPKVKSKRRLRRQLVTATPSPSSSTESKRDLNILHKLLVSVRQIVCQIHYIRLRHLLFCSSCLFAVHISFAYV